MSRLSSAIFEWDKTDLNNLKIAKTGELESSGISNPCESAVMKAITKAELERHFCRKTKACQKTSEEIESLILALTGVTDYLGVPIFKDEVTTIWNEQKKHIPCIQDIEGLSLYTVTGDMMKGNDKLPVFRCARGSTSLESFHNHIVKFIPGTSASAVNFQAYLLDGVSRWNYLRSAAAQKIGPTPIRTFDFRLSQKVNSLSQSLHNKTLVPIHLIPTEYTGELIGIEYLYKQSGFLLPKDEELEVEIDEGFEDYEEEETTDVLVPDLQEEVLPAAPVYTSESEEDDKDDEDEVEEASVLDQESDSSCD